MEKGSDEFNPITFEKRLTALKDTQESIQSMSNWCLKQRTHHKKIVASWLNVLKRVKVEQRLVLFYLANDVIQYSKRKNYEFVESWGLNLQKATPLVRDEKVRQKILRIFKIWEQRSVYDEEFLSDLTGLLSAGAVKKAADDDASDFQPQLLVNKIKQCTVLEGDTDLRLKHIHESNFSVADAEATCNSLKERRNSSEASSAEKELTESVDRVERYTAALQREIVAREALLALLAEAHQYYSRQRQEVKVVAYAYKNFGARVRCLKRKLDEKIEQLPSRAEQTPSPPQPGDLVPSPEPDEDLPLPTNEETESSYNIDKTFSTSLTPDGSMYNPGFSSFLGSESVLNFFQDGTTSDNAGSKIEVINSAGSAASEKSDFNINEFLKNLASDQPQQNSISLLGDSKVTTLPALDLLTPEVSSAAPLAPPQLSFYVALDTAVHEEPEQYSNDPQWSNTPASWGAATTTNVTRLTPPPLAPPPMVPPLSYSDAPESPPPAQHATPVPPLMVPDSQIMQRCDVDHRSLLPPPPPPPSILPNMPMVDLEDIDHRQMPPLPPPIPVAIPSVNRHQHQKDVDHRNLISLTSHPPENEQITKGSLDQDYRVPPPMPLPSDIVESVDMDLSDDEHLTHPDMYQNERHYNPPPPYEDQRNKNNRVLVGGDNGTRRNVSSRSPSKERNLIRINSLPNDHIEKAFEVAEPQSAPPIKPMLNPFDNPIDFQSDELDQDFRVDNQDSRFQQYDEKEVDFNNIEDAIEMMDNDVDPFEEDIRSRFTDHPRNPSPPRVEFEEEWGRMEGPRFPMNPNFQRPWQPQGRPFFRPFGQQRPFHRPQMNRPPWNHRPRGGFW